MNIKDVLMANLTARVNEVAGYQINIDNYKMAIPLADADPDMSEFAVQLRNLLASETLEQKKSKIILAVLEERLKCM